MRFKKIILIMLLLLVILTVSAVSANENLTDTNEDVLKDISSDKIEISDDDIISSTQDEIIKDNGSSTELQQKIDDAGENDTITLENNYSIDSGISILKPLTIDGNGHTIQGSYNQTIFYINATNVVIKNIIFINGGHICNDGDNLTISSCNFTECSVVSSSGGAISNTGNYLNINSCTFTNCIAGDGTTGGAICNTGSYFTITSCNFTTCQANIYHSNGVGAIANFGSYFTARLCNFTNCTTQATGGAIYNSADDITVDSCIFDKCFSQYKGGAIYNQGNGNFTVISCNFSECTNNDDGGAIYNEYASLSVNLSIFDKCTIQGAGGAISNHAWNNLVINSCNFTSCSAWFYGGAIFNFAANSIINSCNFADCYAAEGPDDTYPGDGGTIYNDWNASDCSISFCKFINSYSNRDGGFIYNAANNLTIKYCNLTQGSANGDGGTIYNDLAAYNCSISFCKFINSSSNGYGGFIFNAANNLTIKYCNLTQGSANCSGGAIYNDYGDSSGDYYGGGNCTIISCTFTDCKDNANITIYNNVLNIDGVDCYGNFTAINCNFTDSYKRNVGFKVNFVNCTFLTIPTEITVSNETLALTVGDSVAIDANLTPEGIGNLTYTSNNLSVVKIENDNIIALANGNAIVTVYFSGNENYSAAEKNITVTVSLKDASVNVSKTDYNLYIGDKAVINATSIPDGLNISFSTDDNGVISIDDDGNIVALGEGNATVIVSVGDNITYKYYSILVNVTVKKISTAITSSPITTVYNVAKNLVVTLKDSKNNVLSGVKLIININGAKTYTTDKNGQVKVSTNGLVPKTYNAVITFEGNSNYVKSTAKVKVTVKKATPKIAAKSKSFKKATKTKKYAITLKNNLNKVMKNTKVYIKVYKKTYTAKTNSKGVATFKITKLTKKGTFKSTITYKGNSYYNKVTKKVNIKIK